MPTVRFRIPDLCCPVEFRPIEKALSEALTAQGITSETFSIVPDYGARTVRVKSPTPFEPEALLAAVRAAGFECSRLEDAADERPQSARRRIELHVPEMDCPVEAGEIERAFKAEGVEGAVFDTLKRRIVFESMTDEECERALTAVEHAGYRAHAHGGTAQGASVPQTSEVDGAQARAGRTLLRVPAMDCPVEAGDIEKIFRAHGFTDYVIQTMNRTIEVPSDMTETALKFIAEAGYEAQALSNEARRTTKSRADEAALFEEKTPWGRYGFALAVALLSEAIELGHEYGALGLENVDAAWADGAGLIFALAAVLLVGVGTFKKGIRSALRGTLNMNALMAVAVTGGILIGAWPEAAMVMVLFEISEAIERLSMTKARNSIRNLMEVAPETALVKTNSGFEKRAVEDVAPGALIRVAPGERIPLDGRIRTGITALDQSMVTGESMPAEKGPDDTVWAGTVNLQSTIDVLVTAASGESLTARIIEAVENAQAAKSQTQRFVDRFAEIYTPIVFVVALAVAILPPIFLGDWLGWLYKALCLLVIACPCALVISTPVTIVSALATATRCGLLVKGGLFLEEARKLKSIGLDKTGTLTKGEPELAEASVWGIDADRALVLAASLGAMNKHPLSAALARAAAQKGLALRDVEEFTSLPGKGVSGRIEGGKLFLLSPAEVRARGLMTPESEAAAARAAQNGMSSVALVDTFGLIAFFSLSDRIKEDALEGIRQLRAVGVEPILLTGDNARAAYALAKQLELPSMRAELLPEEKLAAIREMQSKGLCAMVGDGINDAPALAQADIGIAMGVRGTDSAIEAADIAVMDDRISSIASLVRLSRMTHSVLVQNIVFALGVKIAFALLAIAGYATMWMAVFADTGTCLIVVANALRMLRAKPALEREAERARAVFPKASPEAARDDSSTCVKSGTASASIG